MPAPIALTCGDPSGIGPEIAAKARARLGADLSFFWIGDPAHLPQGTRWAEIARPADADRVAGDTLAVLRHDFPAAAAAFRPQVNNPVGGFNHIQIVFNHHNGIATIPQFMQHF